MEEGRWGSTVLMRMLGGCMKEQEWGGIRLSGQKKECWHHDDGGIVSCRSSDGDGGWLQA